MAKSRNKMAIQTPVSIVLPVRNGEAFLQSAMASISGFARNFDEIMVIDDGSTDQTSQILEKWSMKDSRVYVIQSGGIGLADSLNLAISKCTHDWIARADVDDSYSRERLTRQVELISPDVAAIFSDYRIVSTSGHSLGEISTAIFPLPMKLSLVSGNRTPHPSVLFNRHSAILAGGYSKSEFPAEDLGLWVRIQKIGLLKSVPAPLLNYTVSAHSVTALKRKVSIQQRESVLCGLILTSEEIDQLCRNFNFYVKEYLKLPGAYKRISLLYKDRFFYNLKNRNRIPLLPFIHPVLVDPKFILSLLILSFEFAKRRIYRVLSSSK